MEEMLLKTQKYMNAEDALDSIKLGANVERREISERTQKERKGKERIIRPTMIGLKEEKTKPNER